MSAETRWVERVFGRVATYAVTRPWRVLATALVVTCLSLVWAGLALELKTSNLDLIDPDLPPVAAFRAFAEEFGTPNMLVVVLEGEDRQRLEAAVDDLAPRLRAAPGTRAVFASWPIPPALALVAGLDRYFASEDHRAYFLFVQPADPTSSALALDPFLQGVRAVLAGAGLERAGIRAGLTGTPAYALDDRDVIQRDITSLSGFSLALVFGIFALAFGSLRRPILAVSTLCLSVAFAFGPIALFPGHLTLLSAFFASILFGQGADGGIHIIDRVEELVAEGFSEKEAVPKAVAALGPGLLTSNLTNAGALFSMIFAGFRGFAELGWIAGIGMIFCLVGIVTVFPALLVLFDRPRHREKVLSERLVGAGLAKAQSPFLAVTLAGLAIAGFWWSSPSYDADYLNLQPEGSETVRLERLMVERSAYSPQFAVFRAGSREEARVLVERLRGEKTVGAVRSALDLEMLATLSGQRLEDLLAQLPTLVSPQGGWAVFAYPRENVWRPEAQEAFVDAMVGLDPKATGLPVLGHFMIHRSLRAMRLGAWLGGLLILMLVYLDFRDFRWMTAAVLPTLLTALCLPAAMRLVGLSFNPLDVMALPLILGFGVDSGVHMVHRFREERGNVARLLAGAGRSVLMTSLTTMAGFGALMFTQHRGLASFATAMTLGVSLALVFSLFVLPSILARWGRIPEQP